MIEATEDICVGLNDRKSHQNERLQSPATAMPKLSNGTSQTASDKDYNEDKEFQRASKVSFHMQFNGMQLKLIDFSFCRK